MALPKITNCCAIISLKTGTIIIGSIHVVLFVVVSLLCIGVMVSADAIVEYMEKELPNWDQGIGIDSTGKLVLTISPWLFSVYSASAPRRRLKSYAGPAVIY
jgi:hypothetical protein